MRSDGWLVNLLEPNYWNANKKSAEASVLNGEIGASTSHFFRVGLQALSTAHTALMLLAGQVRNGPFTRSTN